MCGIAGILHYNTLSSAKERIGLMTNALTHRGPDAQESAVVPDIAMGHCRLSIIDLSDAGDQPMTDASGRFTIVFNGEIYNYRALKSQLSEYPFSTHSDTEVILASFSRWGIDCVHQLQGMFAFAIWDKQKKFLWLVRDRFGTKPLLLYQNHNCLLFASERRSLLASGLLEKKIDDRGLLDYLSYQSSGYPHTMINGIEAMPPGTYLKVSRQGHEQTRYWDFSHIKVNNNIGQDELQPLLLDKLQQAVSSRLISDVPVGVFLSGGLDSSAVLALTAVTSKERVNTFHLAIDDAGESESAYAELIARRFDTRHIEHRINSQDVLQKITEALDAMDSPTMDGINTFILSSVIRNNGLKVALSGLGGDELFGGYPGFKQFSLLNKQQRIYTLLKPVRKLSSGILGWGSSNLVRKYYALWASNGVEVDEVYPILRQLLTPASIRELTMLTDTTSNLQMVLAATKKSFQHLEPISQFSIAEYLGYAHNTLLRDADQMGMSLGLEIREPFFDHRLVEFVLSLPDHLKSSKRPKQLLFDTLAPLLPEEIFYRPKKGFVLPWDHWMRNELFSFCEGQICSISQRPQFNGQAIQLLWKRFNRKDPRVRWTDIWLFVVLSHWLDKNGF